MIEPSPALAEPIPLPDPITDWALAATPRPDGAVDLVVSLSGPAGATAVCLLLSRDEAREHARAVLRAAGDGAERTHRTLAERGVRPTEATSAGVNR